MRVRAIVRKSQRNIKPAIHNSDSGKKEIMSIISGWKNQHDTTQVINQMLLMLIVVATQMSQKKFLTQHVCFVHKLKHNIAEK
jgi:hypothetical protein